jgi:hypothetical protein
MNSMILILAFKLQTENQLIDDWRNRNRVIPVYKKSV